MSTALKLTFDEFQQMVARQAFDSLNGRDVELIFGELREMSPRGPSHSQAVSRLIRWTTNQEELISQRPPNESRLIREVATPIIPSSRW